jgi:hypothetical protein
LDFITWKSLVSDRSSIDGVGGENLIAVCMRENGKRGLVDHMYEQRSVAELGKGSMKVLLSPPLIYRSSNIDFMVMKMIQ